MLALFPLQLVLFPGESIPLHIFEPRYKQLFGECRSDGIRFGIPPVMNGALSVYGTEAELIRVLRDYDSDEMDVVVRGTRIFRIQEFHEELDGKLYGGGDVAFLDDDSPATEDTRQRFLAALKLREIEPPPNLRGDLDHPLAYDVAPHLGLDLETKADLLAMRSEDEREQRLTEYLEEHPTPPAPQRHPKNSVARNGHSRPRNGKTRLPSSGETSRGDA